MIECSCGCGILIPEVDSRGRPRTYFLGHAFRGRSRLTHLKERALKRAQHEFAVRQKRDVKVCELAHIGGCNGILDVAHLDGDPWNRNPSNLKKLCRCHHRLYDNGRIDLANPIMPKFYVDGGGKRRYERAS